MSPSSVVPLQVSCSVHSVYYDVFWPLVNWTKQRRNRARVGGGPQQMDEILPEFYCIFIENKLLDNRMCRRLIMLKRTSQRRILLQWCKILIFLLLNCCNCCWWWVILFDSRLLLLLIVRRHCWCSSGSSARFRVQTSIDDVIAILLFIVRKLYLLRLLFMLWWFGWHPSE